MPAPELEDEMPSPILEGEVEDPELRMPLEPAFTPEDDPLVTEITRQANLLVEDRLGGMFRIERAFMEKARLRSQNGYATDGIGVQIESWHMLTNQELEQFVQAGSAEAFFASQAAVDMYAEATLTKYAYDDAYDAAYVRSGEGTIPDKQAAVRVMTQDRRYQALFRTIAYRKAKDAVDRFESHVRRATTILQARVKADANFAYAQQQVRR